MIYYIHDNDMVYLLYSFLMKLKKISKKNIHIYKSSGDFLQVNFL